MFFTLIQWDYRTIIYGIQEATMDKLSNYRKIKVPVNQLVPGMVIAESLVNDYGSVVIYENTILNKHAIKKLKSLGYNQILIYDIEEQEIEKNANRFSVRYDEGKTLVKDLIKDVGAGEPLDMDKLRSVTSLLLDQFDNNREIIDTIRQVRDINEYTYSHSMNVALLCSLLGKWIGFNDVTIRHLTYAGLLHDIGKVKVPTEILEKPGPLTPEEYEIIKQHPIHGYKMIKDIPAVNKNVLMGVAMHHEREDGSGYPMAAKGHQIHTFAKIIAIADIYDAMTSERCYRSRQTPFEVLEMFENECFGILEPRYRMTFTSNIANYYIGDMVRLNTDEIAEIIHINPFHISKPLIRINNTYIDLAKEKDLKIVELIL